MTEQGKQPALNSERIASLYGLEGYRLDLSDARCGDGTKYNTFCASIFSLSHSILMLYNNYGVLLILRSDIKMNASQIIITPCFNITEYKNLFFGLFG